jgi:deazaflavin-dependent oxidoreductase (nitroreductase family)
MSEAPQTQKNEPFEEPPREEIPGISRGHVAYLETTDEESAWFIAGMDHVVLHTIGRKSGNEHKVALPVWFDRDGNRVVVASYAGAPENPAWFLNLSDKTANPEVRCRVRGRKFWADAQVLEGDEYADYWAQLTADREYYNDYQSRTDRPIPLVRLVEVRPA